MFGTNNKSISFDFLERVNFFFYSNTFNGFYIKKIKFDFKFWINRRFFSDFEFTERILNFLYLFYFYLFYLDKREKNFYKIYFNVFTFYFGSIYFRF